jgi:hypothetical protein
MQAQARGSLVGDSTRFTLEAAPRAGGAGTTSGGQVNPAWRPAAPVRLCQACRQQCGSTASQIFERERMFLRPILRPAHKGSAQATQRYSSWLTKDSS